MRMRTRAAVQVGNQLKDQSCLTLDVNLTADTRLWYVFCELFVSCIIFWNDSIADESCRNCDCQRMCTWHTVQAKPGSRSRSESAKRQISTFILSKLKLSELQAMRVHWLCKWNLWKGRFWLLRKAKYNIMTKGGLQFRHPCLLWTYRTVGAFCAANEQMDSTGMPRPNTSLQVYLHASHKWPVFPQRGIQTPREQNSTGFDSACVQCSVFSSQPPQPSPLIPKASPVLLFSKANAW